MKSREIIVDSDYNTCGACSIYSIICHYGGYIPLNTIISDTMTDKNGTNAYFIVRALKKYGFEIERTQVRGYHIPIFSVSLFPYLNKFEICFSLQ